MEDNNRIEKPIKATKSKKTLISVIIVSLLCVVGFGVVWTQKDNILNIFSGQNSGDAKEVVASDEETLRKYLEADSILTIKVDKDIETDKGYTVKGTKTLISKVELSMDKLRTEYGQGVLMVASGASLTVDGLTLNGSYVADGIQMEPKAELTFLSGTVKLTDCYGIKAEGKVTIKDIEIDTALHTAIAVESGCEFNMEGGSIKDSASYDMWVCKGATVNISGDTVMKGCYGSDLIYNFGTVTVTGGTFSGYNNTYIFRNMGTLNIDGKEGNYVDCSNSGYAVVATREGGVSNISGLYVHDTNRHAVVQVEGTTTIKDSKFENLGTHAIEIQAGKASIENVSVKNTKSAGLETKAGAVVDIKNFVVDGCDGIGIACRGAKITGENIKISNVKRYGVSCGNSDDAKATLELTNAEISSVEKAMVYAYKSGVIELNSVNLSNGLTRGIFVTEEATVTMNGNSSVTNMKVGGAQVITKGKFVMKSGAIYNNNTEGSGAGVYVTKDSSFVMDGGSICKNTSAARGAGICVTEGIVTINGGKVYDNTAKDGGGMYAQKTSVVTLNKGSITNNKCTHYGAGIFVNDDVTKVKMAGDFYLGKNDVKLNNQKAVLVITGNKLAQHSSSDPLLLTPEYNIKEGGVVATCNSESVARAMALSVDAGDGSYEIVPSDKNYVVKYATADMDMTGADTKYVTNFKELKEAVLGTTGKRYVILKGNIVMPERIRLNGGSTICIKDDGNKRTITRGEGFTDSFFVTHYGTGLYLEATQQGKLVLDGISTNANKAASLVRTAGSTVFRNLVMQNNGSVAKESTMRGAFLRQLYGDFKIYNSILNEGYAESGSAINVDKGTGYINGSIISNNQSRIGGGAIRVNGESVLKVVDSTFENNFAGTAGGAIVTVGTTKVTIVDSNFVDNTASTKGGALSIQDNSTASVDRSSFTNNQSHDDGGAIYIAKDTKITTKDSLFASNKVTDGTKYENGGAIYTTGTYKDINSTFENNVSRNGGAIAVFGGSSEFEGTDANAKFSGNYIVGGQYSRGGAIYVHKVEGILVKVKGYTFTENAAENTTGVETDSYGAGISVGGGSEVFIEQCTFEENKSAKGGSAIFVEADAKVTTQDSIFKKNTTSDKGGAVRVEGTYVDNYSSFEENVANFGGAVAVIKGTATFNGNGSSAFKQNAVKTNANAAGGAIYVHREMSPEVVISNYVFEANTAIDQNGSYGGAIFAGAGSKVDVDTCTFEANQAKKGGAAINIEKNNDMGNANVTTTDCKFEKNKSFGNVSASNGGAIRSEGSYTDNCSSFIENEGRNGGVIAVMGGTATFKGSQGKQGLFEGNKATDSYGTNPNPRGSVIFLNVGTVSVSGYKFDKNITGKGTVYVVPNRTATLNNVTFTESPKQEVYVEGTLNFGDITGVRIRQTKTAAKLVLTDYKDTNEIEIVPVYGEGNKVLTKADALEQAVFESACTGANKVTIVPNGSVKWEMDNTGCLKSTEPVAKIGDTSYYSFADAMTAANASATASVVTLYQNVEIDKTISISKNITIVNKEDIDITLIRKVSNTILFDIKAGGNLTLGSTDNGVTGTLKLDGNKDESYYGRMIFNRGTFILGKNASIENATHYSRGTAMVNYGTAILWGTIQNCDAEKLNGSTPVTNGGVIMNSKENSLIGNLTIEAGSYKNNSAKEATGGFIYTANGATVNIKGGTFSGNTAASGGVLYVDANTIVTIDGGTFSENHAVKGGAIYVLGTLNINKTQTGTDVDVIFEKNEGKVTGGGGAIWMAGTGVSDIRYAKFKENYATKSSGGMFFINETAVVKCYNCIFEGNYTTSTQNGGAVYAKGTSTSGKAYFYAKDCSFKNNNASSNGGAIILQSFSEAVLEGTTETAKFTGNVCNSSKKGSAVFINSNAALYIKGYTFTKGSGNIQSIHLTGKCEYYNLAGTKDTDYSFTGTTGNATSKNWTMPSWVNEN